MGRHTCSTLPLSENLLKPEPADPSTVSSEITLHREASKSQYDKYAQPPLSPLPLGSHAYAKPRPSQRGAPWLYGWIIDNPLPRSYNIDTGNFILCRNQAKLRPGAPPQNIPLQSPPLPSFQPILPETPVAPTDPTPHTLDQPASAVSPQAPCHTPPPITESIPQHLEQQTSDSSPGPDPQAQEMQQTTRSGRPIRKPKKFEDCIVLIFFLRRGQDVTLLLRYSLFGLRHCVLEFLDELVFLWENKIVNTAANMFSFIERYNQA